MPADPLAFLLKPRPARFPAASHVQAVELARELVQHRRLRQPAGHSEMWLLRLASASLDDGEVMRLVDIALCEAAVRFALEHNEALIAKHLGEFQRHGEGQWSAQAFSLLQSPSNTPPRLQLRHLPITGGRVTLSLEALHFHAVHHLRLRLPPLQGLPLQGLQASTDVAAVLQEVKKEGEERRRRWKDLDDVAEDYPPCIKAWLRNLSSGIHLKHYARFNLMAFLGRLNWDTQRIRALFRDRPDYDEREIEFQAQHVRGRDGEQGYAPMGCSKLRSLGLCPDSKCPGVNPLSLYARNRKNRKSGNG